MTSLSAVGVKVRGWGFICTNRPTATMAETTAATMATKHIILEVEAMEVAMDTNMDYDISMDMATSEVRRMIMRGRGGDN